MTTLEPENCSGGQDNGKQVENKKGQVTKSRDAAVAEWGGGEGLQGL